MHRRSEISPVASCLVHEEKLSPFDMFHKLKYIEQCKFCRQLHSMKRRRLALKRGGCNGGLDSEVYLFILDSCQLEAVVGLTNCLYLAMFLEVLMRCCDSYMQLARLNLQCWFLCMYAYYNKSFWCLYVVRMYPL